MPCSVQGLYSVYLAGINLAHSHYFQVICRSHLRFRFFVVRSYLFHVGLGGIRIKQSQTLPHRRKIDLNSVLEILRNARQHYKATIKRRTRQVHWIIEFARTQARDLFYLFFFYRGLNLAAHCVVQRKSGLGQRVPLIDKK